MTVYSVMLEGEEDGKRFLVTVDVATDSQSQAEVLALNEAEHRGWRIHGVEEVTIRQEPQLSATPGVLTVYGKGYFDAEDSE